MNVRILLGSVLILGGLAVLGITVLGRERSRSAQDEQQALLDSQRSDPPPSFPKYFPPSEASLFEGRDLRAFAEGGPGAAEASLVEVLGHPLAELARRDGDSYARASDFSEAERLTLAQALVAAHGQEVVVEFGLERSFDKRSLYDLLQVFVNGDAASE